MNPPSSIKHYLQFKDFSLEEYEYLLDRSKILKAKFKNYETWHPLHDRTLAMIFEKNSTRTRLSFEAVLYRNVHPQCIDPVLIVCDAIFFSGFTVKLPHNGPGRGLAEYFSGIGSGNDLRAGISLRHISAAEGMVVVRVGQEDVIQRPLAKHLLNVIRKSGACESEPRVMQDRRRSVVDQESAVAGNDPHISDF